MVNALVQIPGSDRQPLHGARIGKPVNPDTRITALLEVRRKAQPPRIGAHHRALTRQELANSYGANPADLARVREFAEVQGLRAHFLRMFQREPSNCQVLSPICKRHSGRSFTMQPMKDDLSGIEWVPCRCLEIFRGSLREYSGSTVGRKLNLDTMRNCPNSGPLLARSPPYKLRILYGFPPGDGSGQTIAIVEAGWRIFPGRPDNLFW